MRYVTRHSRNSNTSRYLKEDDSRGSRHWDLCQVVSRSPVLQFSTVASAFRWFFYLSRFGNRVASLRQPTNHDSDILTSSGPKTNPSLGICSDS